MAAKVCPRCGFYNNVKRKRCSLCDAPLDGSQIKDLSYNKKENFYRIQSSNKRNSVLLIIFLFIFLIILGFIFGYIFDIGYLGPILALIISTVTTLISYNMGKSIVLKISGARRVTKEDEPQFVNVVEEIAIAAGLPTPETYIIESNALNAFATGKNPNDSAIAITRGLLNKLNREELSGVVAHEMSHISNLDIRFSMLVGVIVGTIVMLSDWLLRYLFWGRRGKRNRREGGGGAEIIILLIAILLAIIAPILAKLIQMSISRKRELMADAKGVEFTRNPEGLASALEKIAQSSIKLETATRATAHMFISNPFKDFSKKSSALFSTHPPIESRIRILRSM